MQALGLLKQCPKPFDYVMADARYDSDFIREGVTQDGGYRRHETQPISFTKALFDKQLYKERHRIENLIAKLKHSRRLATRYDKRTRHDIAFAHLAAIKIWIVH